ncbi:hypothetical protein [Pseudarthrobacter phenanthrenivorans]|uniref:hypothetical protein n=1 Tax=Pseudarthrobacter phenanthrenivorans TaxID=361575 RepID=UPI00030D1CF7|nr:hypothetical protein [Pseudarthrobacter phenanthrenivorans]
MNQFRIYAGQVGLCGGDCVQTLEPEFVVGLFAPAGFLFDPLAIQTTTAHG